MLLPLSLTLLAAAPASVPAEETTAPSAAPITGTAVPASNPSGETAPDDILVGIGAGGETGDSEDGMIAGDSAQDGEAPEPVDPLWPGSKSTLTMDDVAEEYSWVKENLASRLRSYVIEHADGNPNVIHFLYEWGHDRKSPAEGEFEMTDEELSADIPLLMQWDARWGFDDYGTGPAGLTGCAPTCLAMVGLGLTHDPELNPKTLAAWSDANGYYVPGSGTSWGLITDGLIQYGIVCNQISTAEGDLTYTLSSGLPVIINVNPGKFTAVGHFMVLSGVDGNGRFTLLDPNNIENCSKTWSYSDLSSDMTSAWSFSLAG